MHEDDTYYEHTLELLGALGLHLEHERIAATLEVRCSDRANVALAEEIRHTSERLLVVFDGARAEPVRQVRIGPLGDEFCEAHDAAGIDTGGPVGSELLHKGLGIASRRKGLVADATMSVLVPELPSLDAALQANLLRVPHPRFSF